MQINIYEYSTLRLFPSESDTVEKNYSCIESNRKERAISLCLFVLLSQFSSPYVSVLFFKVQDRNLAFLVTLGRHHLHDLFGREGSSVNIVHRNNQVAWEDVTL